MKLSLLFRSLIRRSAVDRDLDEEFAFHIENAIDENMRRGMNRAEAVFSAHRAFGFVPLEKERCRDARGLVWLDDLRQDLAYGARNLIRTPVFTAVALLSLALGIGAATAMFSLVDAVVLRGIPFPQADRLIVIEEKKQGAPTGGNPSRFQDWRDQAKDFSAITGFYSDNATLLGRRDPAKIGVMRVTGSYFAVTGVEPAQGRAFTADELARGAPVAIISHALGRQSAAALNLSGKLYTVIGVMPPGDAVLDDVDVWTPMPLDILATTRRAGFLREVARLSPGFSVSQAQAQMSAISQRLSRAHPDTDRGLAAEISPLRDELLRESKTSMLLLGATVGFFLLIACVNIAGMLLSRSASRQRESAIRIALGAGRARLLRMFLVESAMLSFAGGALGLGFVPLFLALLRLLLPADLVSVATAHLNLLAAALAFAVALVCGLVVGCVPAWQLSSASPLAAIKEAGASSPVVSRMRLRRILVMGEVAISFVLLAGAALLGRSFIAMISQPLGFQPEHALAVNISFPWDTNPGRLETFYTQALAGLAGIDGVRSIGLIDRLPLSGGSQGGRMILRDGPLPGNAPSEQISLRAVRAQYFAAIGAPMLSGTPLADRAPHDAQRKTIVNQTLASRYFGSENPIGKFVAFDPKAGRPVTWYQIAGVVADIRQSALQAVPAEAYILPGDTYWPELKIILRAQGNPLALAAAARATIRRVDPNQPIDSIETLDDHVKKSSARQAMHAWMLTGFAALALLLAAIGVYGLMASDVALRTREIGLRVALGADYLSVLTLIVRSGMILAGSGAVIGCVAASVLSRYLQSLLFGIATTDFVAFGLSVVLVLAVALIAILIPAARALNLDPAAILRHE